MLELPIYLTSRVWQQRPKDCHLHRTSPRLLFKDLIITLESLWFLMCTICTDGTADQLLRFLRISCSDVTWGYLRVRLGQTTNALFFSTRVSFTAISKCDHSIHRPCPVREHPLDQASRTCHCVQRLPSTRKGSRELRSCRFAYLLPND
jgi:hypothetical protein